MGAKNRASKGSKLTPSKLEIQFFNHIAFFNFAIVFSLWSSFESLKTFPSVHSFLFLSSLVLACSATVLRHSLKLTTISAACFGAQVIAELPESPNHRHVLLFAILLILAGVIRARGSQKIAASVFFTDTAPALRLLTSIIYFFAFLAKLNWDYLDPEVSCSIRFYNNIKLYFPFLPTDHSIQYFVIYGSIALEACLPFFLVFSRTRNIGVFLALSFHYLLAFDLIKYFTNFSATMFALLALFIPPSAIQTFFDTLWANQARKLIGVRALRVVYILAMLCVCSLGFLATFSEPQSTNFYLQLFAAKRHVFWLVFATPLVLISSSILFSRAVSDSKSSPLRYLELAIVFLAVVNGASPYLGLKTRTSFNMYSNMRIEPLISNHLVVSSSPDLLGFLSEPIEVMGNSSLVCNSQITSLSSYPAVEIARRIDECPDEEIILTTGTGQSINFRDKAEREKLVSNYSWLAKKLAIFRPLDRHAATDCMW